MPVEPFVALLDRWRHADGMFARARALTEAVRLLRNLTPDERRMLARALAERGAPDLAEQLEGSVGGAMGAERVRHVADRLLSMDDDELGALVESLRDPDQRRRLATDAVDRAFAGEQAAPGGPTSPPPGAVGDDAGPPPPPGAPARPAAQQATSELDAAAADARDTLEAQRARLQELAAADDDLDIADLAGTGGELGDQALGGIELGSTELGAAGLGGVALGTADLVEADVVDVGLGTEDRVDAGADATPEAPTDAGTPVGPSGAPGTAAADTPIGDADTPTGRADTPADAASAASMDVDSSASGPRSVTAPVVVGSVADAGRDLHTQAQDAADPTEGPRRDLLARLAATEQAMARLRVLQDVSLDALDTAGALQVIDAFPDGWQRRRAAQRLVAAGVLQDVGADDLVQRFARAGDATFVVGGLIDAGHLDVDALDGLLPAATVTRLRHRREH